MKEAAPQNGKGSEVELVYVDCLFAHTEGEVEAFRSIAFSNRRRFVALGKYLPHEAA
jgi:hypothetical protein